MPTQRKFDAVAELLMMIAYELGWIGPQIADNFRCSAQTVYSILHKRGVSVCIEAKPILTTAQQRQVALLYQRGCLMRELLDLFGCSAVPIHRALHSQNVPIRGNQVAQYVPTPKQIETATAKIRESWSKQTYFERAGVSREPMTVTRVRDLPPNGRSVASND